MTLADRQMFYQELLLKKKVLVSLGLLIETAITKQANRGALDNSEIIRAYISTL